MREVLLTGDFFITPPRTVLDLEARLRRADIATLGDEIESFFETARLGLATVGANEFAAAAQAALASGR